MRVRNVQTSGKKNQFEVESESDSVIKPLGLRGTVHRPVEVDISQVVAVRSQELIKEQVPCECIVLVPQIYQIWKFNLESM